MSEQAKPSSLINWVGYLGITMLVLLPLSVITVRSGVWQQGLLLFALACLGSAVLLVICLSGSPNRAGVRMRFQESSKDRWDGTNLDATVVTDGGS
jgi:hypothetical protein